MANANVHVKWTGARQFIGTDSGKHSIVISSHDEANRTGVKPSDLLLLALGTCSGYDVVSILEKKRMTLNSLEIHIQARQDPDPPWTFREIRLMYHVSGQGLTPKAVDQAIHLSLTKYCSVAVTISGRAKIEYEYAIGEQQG